MEVSNIPEEAIEDLDFENAPEDNLEAQFIRIVLQHAGYDVSRIQDPKNLDKEAQDVFNAQTTSERYVFCSWPRDSKGKPNVPITSLSGKTTSNGIQLWGATLYDFDYVKRLPENSNFSTGSKLAAWMKANGELDWAAPEITGQRRSRIFKKVPPCDVVRLVEDINF